MSRFLITGGAGFIGSHLAKKCLLFGHDVIVLDDLSHGYRENVLDLEDRRNFALVRGSACDRELLELIVKKADIVFHLAAATTPIEHNGKKCSAVTRNYEATATVLDTASRFRKKVVLASSCDVYQDDQETPHAETHAADLASTGDANNLAKVTKLVDECLARESQCDTVVARIFPTFGPRMSGGLGGESTEVVLLGMAQAIQEQPVFLGDDVPDVLNLVDVRDVVQWLLILGTDPNANKQVFNLGRPKGVSTRQLQMKIAQITDSLAVVRDLSSGRHSGARKSSCRLPDITRIVELTGYRPRFSLDDTLRKIFFWINTTDRFGLMGRAWSRGNCQNREMKRQV